MSFLYDNIAPLAVAAVASVLVWVWGGAVGSSLVPVLPWLIALMIEAVFFCPQRHRGESIYEARDRVWGTLGQSKIFWVTLGFLALLCVPFVNNGLCPSCDATAIAQGVDARPPLPVLPFCVDRMDHLAVVLGFATVLLSALGVTFCLTRRGQRLVLSVIIWNGVAVALLGFLQSALKAPGPYWTVLQETYQAEYFATFGYVNMAGDYFTLLFGLAAAMWCYQSERARRERKAMEEVERTVTSIRRSENFWKANYYLFPAALFFFAALNTLSRAAIILVTMTACLYFFHVLVVRLSRMSESRRVTVGVWSAVAFLVVIFFATVFMPNKIQREVGSLSGKTVLDRMTGKAQYHSRVAASIWSDHLLFGCGGWGYQHLSVPKMQELKIGLNQLQDIGGANVHNDYLQFLCEHGLVGLFLLLAVVFLIVSPTFAQWKILAMVARFKKSRHNPVPRPVHIFALPESAFVILVACGATFVHAFGDCPLRSVAISDVLLISLAALPGFMPREMPTLQA